MTMPMRPPPAPGVQQTSRPAENVPTQLLTAEENQRLFRLLGERCQTLATAVVQLYCTSPPTHTAWIRHDTGVMCFVRDNSRRAYFLQLYSADARVWEQELYQNFQYSRTRGFFHTFEAHDCRAGLNFADDSEAEHFGRRVEDHLRNKQLKKEQRNRSRQMAESRHSNGTVPRSGTLPQQQQQRSVPTQQLDRGPARGRQKKSKLSKADISLPTNFQHISHVGWDPHKGFDLENVDPNLKQFFNRAGVSDTQLQDQDTRKFIYDFIDKHGGVEAAIKEVHQLGGPAAAPGPPPPVPTRQPPTSGRPVAPPAPPVRSTPPLTHSGAAPPPPPSRTRQAPPQPPSAAAKPGMSSQPPPPPTPNSAPPPPPPPPPPPAGVPAPPAPPPPPPPSAAAKPGGGLPTVSDSRSQLLDSIRAGTTLKPVSASTATDSGGGGGGGGTRDDLMAQIRGGATLRPVTDKSAPPPAASEAAPPGLAGALARALADRKRVIHSSDEDDDDEDEEDDDDEWED